MRILKTLWRKLRWRWRYGYWPEGWEVEGREFKPLKLAPCAHRYVQVRHRVLATWRPDGGRDVESEVICADCGVVLGPASGDWTGRVVDEAKR